MTRLRLRAGARIVALLLLASFVAACTERTGSIEISIRRSAFEPAAISVEAGSTVTFRIRNDDPIAHEFILGTSAEQAAHEEGTEETHDGAPGAASLEPDETAVVTYTFARAGDLEYACHLPGHYAYGMRGTVTVS